MLGVRQDKVYNLAFSKKILNSDSQKITWRLLYTHRLEPSIIKLIYVIMTLLAIICGDGGDKRHTKKLLSRL